MRKFRVLFFRVSFRGYAIKLIFSPLNRVVEPMHNKVFFLKFILLLLEKSFEDFGLAGFSVFDHVYFAAASSPNVLKIKVVKLFVLKWLSRFNQRLDVKVDWIVGKAFLF